MTKISPTPPLGVYPHERLWGQMGITPKSASIKMISSMVPSDMMLLSAAFCGQTVLSPWQHTLAVCQWPRPRSSMASMTIPVPTVINRMSWATRTKRWWGGGGPRYTRTSWGRS